MSPNSLRIDANMLIPLMLSSDASGNSCVRLLAQDDEMGLHGQSYVYCPPRLAKRIDLRSADMPQIARETVPCDAQILQQAEHC